MSDIEALKAKIGCNFTYRQFDTDFLRQPPAPPERGPALSEVFARLQSRAAAPMASSR
jgi:hypothetical protein